MMTVYCTSKAALDRMTQVEALRLAPFGVRINNINPGPFSTNIAARNNLQMDASHEAIGVGIFVLKSGFLKYNFSKN